MKSGIIYLLNSILKKYDRALDGILIGYQNIKVLMDENTGIIQMGTAETEVNVTVEFYIFQPKIGSRLQGVVNKKSNNHIGCLVHKYFNATILKPEDVKYEDWICKDLNIDDKIVFKVKDLDFTGLLPYIEGMIEEDELRDILNEKKESGCNLGNNVLTDGSENEMCSPKKGMWEVESTEDAKDRMKKIKKEAEKSVVDNELNDNVHRLIENELNEDNIKSDEVKKRKKEKKKKTGEIENITKSEKEAILSTVPKLVANQTKVCDVDQLDGKRKKKKKKKEKVYDSFGTLPQVENLLKEVVSDVLGSKTLRQEEDEFKLNNLVEEKKKKKKKKEKKDKTKGENFEGVIENKMNKCLVEREDSILHSTQLAPFLKPMEMSFCSPIPVPLKTPPGEKRTKKHKKPQMDGTTDTTKGEAAKSSKKEKSNRKRKREEMDEADAGEPDSKKFINLEPFSKGKMTASPVKNERLSESGDEKSKSTVHSLLEEIYRKQMSRVKQEWGTPDRESSSSETKAASKKASKKEKKEKLLYEKLMKQARTAINFEDEPPKVAAQPEPSKRKSPFSTSIGLAVKGKKEKERSSGGNKDRKRKSSEGPEGPSPKKLKNGSMYLMDSSPEKLKEDKSLFSDSECSKGSPAKKKMQMNGDVSGSEVTKSKVERTTEERRKSEVKGKEGEREKEKIGKSERGSGKSGKKVEDLLYDKLLRDAKSLINSSKEEAPAVHPKKDLKKQKTLDSYLKPLL